MLTNIFKEKKVVITGNTGFKGSWLTVWLSRLGADIIGIADCIPTNPSMFEVLGLKKKIKYYEQDIRETEEVVKLIEKESPDYLFHLAAQAIVSQSYENPIDTFQTNVIGTASILEALRKAARPCVAVIITSDKCYENVEWCWGYRETDHLGGKDPYSSSKAAAEMVFKAYYNSYFKESDIHLISARAGNVIGGGDWAVDRIVPDCYRAWANGLPVVIRNPKSTRPWQHVLEPLSGYLRAARLLTDNPELSGQSYNFGPPADQIYTVIELLKKLSTYWDFKGRHEKYLLDKHPVFEEAGLLKLNCDKSLFDLGWSSVLNFEQTARFTSEWYNNFYGLNSDMIEFTLNQIDEYENIAEDYIKK